MHKIFIFGYGSLINLLSASATLDRELKQNETVQMKLFGYQRVWDYHTTVYSEALNKKVNAVYLNLIEDANKQVNGLAFEVSESELNRLIIREKFYELIDVTQKVDVKIDGKVYAFVCSDSNHIAINSNDFFVMQRYIDIVEEGCKKQGDDFYNEYKKSTRDIPFDIIPGKYRFND